MANIPTGSISVDYSPATSRAPIIVRWLVAGPLALIASVLTMAGMSVCFPQGGAGINHLAFPIVLFPAIWSLFFFYALLESRPGRAGLVLGLIAAANAVPVISAVSKLMAGAPA